MKNLRRQDARIIVGLFYVVAARRVLCELYHQKLYGQSYVWFFIGWYEDDWFEINLEKEGITCTKEQMRMAAEGHLTTEALMWNQNNDTTISGMTAEDFRKRLNKLLKDDGYDIDNNRYPEGYQEAPLAYDAVWSVALGKSLEYIRAREFAVKSTANNYIDSFLFVYAISVQQNYGKAKQVGEQFEELHLRKQRDRRRDIRGGKLDPVSRSFRT